MDNSGTTTCIADGSAFLKPGNGVFMFILCSAPEGQKLLCVPACSEDSFTYVTQVLKMLHKYASPPVPLGWMIQGCVVPGGAAKPTHIIGVASSRMCTVLHMFSGVQAFKAGLPGPCGGLRKRRAELWDVKQCKDTRTLIFSSLLPDKVRV